MLEMKLIDFYADKTKLKHYSFSRIHAFSFNTLGVIILMINKINVRHMWDDKNFFLMVDCYLIKI